MSDWLSTLASASSRLASRMAASSATLGWNSWDLLLNVCGRGVGSGSTGSTEQQNVMYNTVFDSRPRRDKVGRDDGQLSNGGARQSRKAGCLRSVRLATPASVVMGTMGMSRSAMVSSGSLRAFAPSTQHAQHSQRRPRLGVMAPHSGGGGDGASQALDAPSTRAHTQRPLDTTTTTLQAPLLTLYTL